ncbi:MAG: cell division protein SepF [Oscillospiraceae bacterium]|nr:cell division protein SepF [Oscillospiraceae bacterium]
MGFMDKYKEWARVEDDEEDEFDEFVASEERTKGRESSGSRRDDRVVNIHTTTQLQVVLVKPERYENSTEIADHLKEKRTVVLNLESTNKDAARRILDFLSGVAYTNDGQIKRVANSTYIITPYNVDLKGDLIDELENNGLYF